MLCFDGDAAGQRAARRALTRALPLLKPGHSLSIVTLPAGMDPDDVVKCLDQLYRQRRIDLAHARILRIWGERQLPPSAVIAAERSDHKLWIEALERLDPDALSPREAQAMLYELKRLTREGAK